MNSSAHRLSLRAENSLTVLPRILLMFSRRRIVVDKLDCRLNMEYHLTIEFIATPDQARLLQRQLEKQEEVIEARLDTDSVPATEHP